MKIVFFGTPEYVVPVLDTLSHEHEIVAVVTQPPRPVGRKQFREFSPVDTWAHKRKVKIFFEPAKIVEKKIEADMGALAAYGEIVAQNVINHFRYGILNVHPSCLPKYRGASPVQGAIAAGEKVTGVSIMKLDKDLDHGPILSSFKEDLNPNITAGALRDLLFERSASFLAELIPNYINGRVKPKEQNHTDATFTKVIKKDFGKISAAVLKDALEGRVAKTEFEVPFVKGLTLEGSAENLHNFIRALNPWPMAWTEVKLTKEDALETRLKILRSCLENGRLVLSEVQLAGKNPVTWDEFNRGYPENSLKEN